MSTRAHEHTARACRVFHTNERRAGQIKSVSIVYREDLGLPNHLAGHQRKLMQLSFDHVQQLMDVKAALQPLVAKNKARAERADAYAVLTELSERSSGAATVKVLLLAWLSWA